MAAAADENTGTCGLMGKLQQFFMQLTNINTIVDGKQQRNVCLLVPFDLG